MKKTGREEFCRECAKEIAARLLRKVRRSTPVGKTNGGTLRRNWSVGEINKMGENYMIEVINPTEYASYVEHGHRTRNHTGWTEGRHMLTITANEIDNITPKLVERKLRKKLESAINGK